MVDYQGCSITFPVMTRAPFDATLHGNRAAGVTYIGAPGNSLRVRYVISNVLSNTLSAVARHCDPRVHYAASRIRSGLPIPKRIQRIIEGAVADEAWRLIEAGDECYFVKP
jgi:hypothetical protein